MPFAFFDIVGTCFGYEAVQDAIESQIGTKIKPYGISSKLLLEFWVASSYRDGIYRARIGLPPFEDHEHWKRLWTQVLFQAGVPQADLDRVCTKEDKDVLVDATLHRLRPREGLAEMLRVLEEGGVTFVTCSGASVSRVRNYFESVGIDLPSAQIYDSAPIGQHKPEMIVYETVLAEYQAKYPEETLIFSAAHHWDVCGAKAAGFKTAYCTAYEGVVDDATWLENDIVADDLASLGKAIVAKYGKKAV